MKYDLFFGTNLSGHHMMETKNLPFFTRMVAALTANSKAPYTAPMEIVVVSKSANGIAFQ